ncbi:MAG: xanthine dehydrogenase family protein subunit M [Rhodospirillaceae bacterium]|nr:xanthine dehydrogenase family protein subunit M [Rhodospirillaceae bacterium]
MKDMMPNFDLFQPADVAGALALLDKHGAKAWRMAGGQDSLDWFKDRAKRPQAVIDLAGIAELKGIHETAAGIEIGAMTTLVEVASSPVIRDKYAALADAAGRVASPQIRNVGTIGGNLCQDARCWYYRYGLDCYRAGGNTCYAGTPQGMNREHCLFGASRCVAVTPSDTAPVMVALEAEMVVRSSKGERVVPAEQFFIGPAVDIMRMVALEPNELLVAIRLPAKWAGARFYFEKVADRNTWDFALVNVAAAMKLSTENVIEDIRIVCGGVECVPRRMTAVEDIVKGSAKNEETANLAASSAARGAVPLNFNHFKIPLMESLVRRAIRDA